MIFVITPDLNDFKAVCYLRRIPVEYNFNGLPKNPDIRWVASWRNLVGFKIHKEDTVIYGSHYSRFSKDELERLPAEIDMRRRKQG